MFKVSSLKSEQLGTILVIADRVIFTYDNDSVSLPAVRDRKVKTLSV